MCESWGLASKKKEEKEEKIVDLFIYLIKYWQIVVGYKLRYDIVMHR